MRGQLVHGGVPPLLRVRQGDPVRVGAGVPGRQHLVLDRLQRLPLRARQDPLGLCLGLAGQLGHDLVLDQPAPGVHEFRVLHPRLVVQMPGRPGQGQLRVLPGDQLRRVLQRDQRARLRGEVAVVDLGELLEGVDLFVDDRGVLVQRLLGRDVGGVVHLVPVVLQAADRAQHRVQPVGDAGGRLLDRVRLPDQLRDRLVGVLALVVEGGPGAVRRGQPGGRQAALPLQRQRRVGAHGAGRPAQLRLVTQPQALREHLDRRHTPHGGEGDAGHQGQQPQGEAYGTETAPGTCPSRHRRPRAISGERGTGKRNGRGGWGTGAGVGACRARHMGCAGCYPYKWVCEPGLTESLATPSQEVSGHRVPAAANRATADTFDLVTNAGPVSTGAVPPPLTLPLVRYSHRASTAR